MEKNNRIIKIGVILVGALMTGCIIFAYYIRIDKPVFFTHYYEYQISKVKEENGVSHGEVGFRLQYISDITDKRLISYVVFKDHPEISFNANNQSGFFMINNNNMNYGTNYGRYSVRTVNLNAYLYDLNQYKEDLKLSEASIYFNNGDVVAADTGEIILYLDQKEDPNINMLSSSSSSTGLSKDSYRVKNDITVINLESPLLEKLKPLIEIKINGKDYNNIDKMDYHPGDSLYVESKTKASKEPDSEFLIYDIEPKLYYKDKEDNRLYIHLLNIRNTEYYNLNFLRILKYIKTRG